MVKKIIVLGILLAMTFSLSSCTFDNLAAYRAAARATLVTYAESKGQENYTPENWTLIQGHVATGVEVINNATDKVGVRSARDAAKHQIGIVPRRDSKMEREWGYSECGDFALSISVEQTTLQQGENFVVNIELRNLSGNELEIARYFLFYPSIPSVSWIIDRVPPPLPTFEVFEKAGSIFQTLNLDSYYELDSGIFQLQVNAMFFVNWQQPSDPESESIPWQKPSDAQQINIISNTIVLTVQ